MTKVLRMLAGGGLAAVLGAVLFGFSGAFSAQEAAAESPPNPPSRFAGSVLVDGAAPAAGTVITAMIGNTTCGVTTVFMNGAEARYTLDVPALDPGATPNCGTDGAVVKFLIGDKLAAETGTWANYQLSVLNLTYTTPSTQTATASPTGGTATTTATPTGTGTGTAPTGTPKAPTTGNYQAEDGGSSTLFLIVLGAGVVALSAGGAAVARRGR
jgi:hypothetical protein